MNRNYSRTALLAWLEQRQVDDDSYVAEFMGFHRFANVRAWLCDPACQRETRGKSLAVSREWVRVQLENGFDAEDKTLDFVTFACLGVAFTVALYMIARIFGWVP